MDTVLGHHEAAERVLQAFTTTGCVVRNWAVDPAGHRVGKPGPWRVYLDDEFEIHELKALANCLATLLLEEPK